MRDALGRGASTSETDYGECGGQLSYAALCNECPFPSEMVVCELDGATLAMAVTSSRAAWPSSVVAVLTTRATAAPPPGIIQRTG